MKIASVIVLLAAPVFAQFHPAPSGFHASSPAPAARPSPFRAAPQTPAMRGARPRQQFLGQPHPGPHPPAVGWRAPYAPGVFIAPYPFSFDSGYDNSDSDDDQGGGDDSGFDSSAPQAPPESDRTTVVAVNRDFHADGGKAQIIDFSNVPAASDPATEPDRAAPADDQPTVFLIALTDHTVLASIAYWVDGDTLNWVSRDAKQNHISLSLVDRQFSKQLNEERHVPFTLPPPARP